MTIKVRDLFSDGNAFALMGKCRGAAKKAGWSAERLKAFSDDCMSGDYNHLLTVVFKDFDELDEDEGDEETFMCKSCEQEYPESERADGTMRVCQTCDSEEDEELEETTP